MHASSVLAILGAAGIASALPDTEVQPPQTVPTSFNVTNFHFGFTSSGYYSGNFTVPGFVTETTCKGNSTSRDWQICEASKDLFTYLSKNDTTQQYTLNAVFSGYNSTYYFGKEDVYSETGVDRSKAKQNFDFPVYGHAQTA